MPRPHNPTRKLELKLDRIEKLVSTLRGRCAFLSQRLSAIYHNQKHYMRYRAKRVDKRQMSLLAAARQFKKKIEAFPQLNFKMTGKCGRRVVLLVTPNHARKLRALAEIDLRPLLNGARNFNAKKRVSLAKKGHKAYRVTE